MRCFSKQNKAAIDDDWYQTLLLICIFRLKKKQQLMSCCFSIPFLMDENGLKSEVKNLVN